MKQIISFRKSALFILYIIGFMFSLRIALPSYINSSFIEGITTERLVGLIYMISAIFTILAFLVIPRIINKVGSYYTILSLVTVNILALIGLSFSNNPFVLISFFIINGISAGIIGFCLDFFVEYYSKDVETGRIRSFYLTATNVAWLFAPFAAAKIAGEGDFQNVFFVAALIMSAVVLASALVLRETKDIRHRHFKFKDTIKEILQSKNVSSIMVANFVLQVFYAVMIIYMPIYLTQHIGFSIKEMGIAFTIMLLPFVLIQIPIGWLADKIVGEKEFLITGFILMAIFTASLSFVTSTSFIVWGLLLFMTRIGAALVELMAETYFYKKITAGDSNLINIFKMTTQVAYVISSFVVILLLGIVGIKYLWVLLGVFMFLGIKYGLRIEDTK